MSKHSIVQTEAHSNYTKTETMKEHRNSAFASSKQTLKESSVQFELQQQSAEATTMKKLLPHAQQASLFLVTTFYADNLLLEEGNKCFEFVKCYGLCMSNNLHCKRIGMKKLCINSYATLQWNMTNPWSAIQKVNYLPRKQILERNFF